MSNGLRNQTRTSRAERVAIQVEDEILEARLPVGAHLGRRVEFMERFRISPTVMNETLRILRTRGLVGVRPGNGGGVFVASLPPQVRLGAMDLWFNNSRTNPLDLFEARVHLENALTEVAFERATTEDIALMDSALERMRGAADARAFLEGVVRLHRTLVTASRVVVLDDMHQAISALLIGSLTRASFVEGYEEMLLHSIQAHEGIVQAIRNGDRTAFDAVMGMHHEDMIRVDDPRRSPDGRKIEWRPSPSQGRHA